MSNISLSFPQKTTSYFKLPFTKNQSLQKTCIVHSNGHVSSVLIQVGGNVFSIGKLVNQADENTFVYNLWENDVNIPLFLAKHTAFEILVTSASTKVELKLDLVEEDVKVYENLTLNPLLTFELPIVVAPENLIFSDDPEKKIKIVFKDTLCLPEFESLTLAAKFSKNFIQF